MGAPGALVERLIAMAGGGVGETLADRPDGTVVRVGRMVAKAHAPDADPGELTARLALAASAPCAGILLPPHTRTPLPLTEDTPHPAHERLGSLWPYGTPVDPEAPENAPWEAAGTLLARLHAVPVPAQGQLPTPVPAMRGPAKAAAALERMRATQGAGTHRTAAAAVERAWAALPGWARAEEPAPRTAHLCHGDFHLGQLVRHPAPNGPWLLIDVDDLGLGDPAWDLARPAAWYATGLLGPAEWHRFLDAYTRNRTDGEAERGTGRSLSADPWRYLDVPARALTAQTAALAVAKARAAGRVLDEAEEACVAACARIAAVHTASQRPAPQGA